MQRNQDSHALATMFPHHNGRYPFINRWQSKPFLLDVPFVRAPAEETSAARLTAVLARLMLLYKKNVNQMFGP